MDAPKRITLASREWERLVLWSVQFHDGMDIPEKEFGPLTEYIRADIVEQLIDAANGFCVAVDKLRDIDSAYYAHASARVAHRYTASVSLDLARIAFNTARHICEKETE